MLADHTLLDTFERCEQEAVYRFRDHLEPAAPEPARLFGQAVHAGIRQFYELPYNTPAMLGAVERAWGGAPFGPENWRTLEYALRIVEAYAVEYPASKWDFEVLMNERYLEDAHECGIVDRVVRRKADGLLYVLDLKTTGWWPSPAWQEQWRHSQQAARYLKLVENNLDVNVAGFWCDAIYVARRGTTKPEDFVRVGPFAYSADLRAELAFQRGMKMGRISKIFSGGEPALKNTRSCYRYNSLCPFLKFCVADYADRADMIKLALANGELVEREWKPKERDA